MGQAAAVEVLRLGPNDTALLGAAMRAFRGFERRADPAFLSDGANVALVARNGDTVVGWGWGRRVARPDGTSMLVLFRLEVAGAVRREGVGRALLEAFAEVAREGGHDATSLMTDAGVAAARALYPAAAAPSEALGPWWVFG
jgi:GNAT superfamily N-acetyltransferase